MSPLDEHATLNARVAVLEDWRREHRDWMNEMRVAITGLTTSVHALRLCSSPNTCVALRDEISEMALEHKSAMRRIESLERWRTFISGVIATIGVLWMILQVVIPVILRFSGVEQ